MISGGVQHSWHRISKTHISKVVYYITFRQAALFSFFTFVLLLYNCIFSVYVIIQKPDIRGHLKSTFIEEGRGRVIEKQTKMNRGRRGSSICVRSLFLKKMLRFSKWSFVFILQFFLLIIMKIDFSARFYFAQLFSALSIISLAHF